MKPYLIFIFLFILLPTKGLALIDYQLEVQLIPAEQRLVGTAVISVEQIQERTLKLKLAGTCELVAVHQSGRELNTTFKGGLLAVELLSRKPLIISYRGRFTDQVSGTPVHNEDPSYGVSAGIATEGTFLSAAADWYPRLNHENIHYRLTVSAPLGVEAITSGRRVDRHSSDGQSHSIWEVDYPLYGLTLSAGAYQVFEDVSGDIPIYAYFYADSVDLVTNYLREARSYLNLYEELFGPYPFHKFAIVENFFPTGYGFPSWTLLGSRVIRLPFIVKTSLGHEIAHSWWGTGVRVDYSQGNWAEGLTTYVADYLYQERTSETAAHEYRLKILRDYAELVGAQNAFPLSQFLSRNDKASQSVGYGKAAMLFHMLRKQVGERLFWSVLKEIAQKHMFQTISWNHFAEQFSTAADSDLTAFFDQWLKRESGPKLTLRGVEAENTGNGYLIRGILEQSAPYYQLGFDLQIETETGLIKTPLSIKGRSQEFILKSTERPLALVVDPATDLFRILNKEEIPPTVNAVRSSTKLMVLSADSYVPTTQATTTLLGALRKTDVPVQRLANVSAADLAEHDILLLGVSNELKPKMLSSERIRLAGTEVVLKGKSAFVVLPHPTRKDRIMAWFVSADPSGDAVVARKIPHYGKYSYLLFEGSTNQLKGTFSPDSSPLRVDFFAQQKN